MFVIQPVVVTKTWKQAKYPSAGEWIGNWFMNIIKFNTTEIMKQIIYINMFQKHLTGKREDSK